MYVLELIHQGLLSENNLLIGAWDNFKLFDKNCEIEPQDFKLLCSTNGYESWKELYID